MTLTEKVKALRLGESFNVKTGSERTMVLNIAKILNLRISTRARGDKTGKANGFTVTRLPE